MNLPIFSFQRRAVSISARLGLLAAMATTVLLTTLAPQRVLASAAATDNACSSGYTGIGDWTGNNGGSGFGVWLESAGGGGGAYRGDSNSNNGGSGTPGINSSCSGNFSWGLYAGGTTINTNFSRITRTFTSANGSAALQIGQTFSIDMDNGYIETGGIVGFALQNSSGQDVLQFKYVGNSSTDSYQLNGAYLSPTVGYTGDGLRVTVTLLTATTYTVTVAVPNSGTATSYSASSLAPGGGSSIDRVILFTDATGSGTDHDLFFNGMSITCPSFTVTTNPASIAVCSGSAASFTATATAASNPTYQWQVSTDSGSTWSNVSTGTGGTTGAYTTAATTSGLNGYQYRCIITDACGTPATSSAATLTVNSPTITTTSPLPPGMANVAYSTTLAASGSSPGNYTFTTISGTLPTGMTLSMAGEIAGTTATPGTYNFTVQVQDDNGCSSSKAFALVIQCNVTITISPASLSPVVGTSYSQQLTASGGMGPYIYTVADGSLPAGLSMDSSGLITGIPTSNASVSFSVAATDTNGCPGIQSYNVTPACPAIMLSPASLPNGTVGTSYGTQTVSASGANGVYTFAVTVGTLPAGLSLNGANGQITGTPTSSTAQTFTITATDSSGCTGSMSYTVTPVCPTITVTPITLPNLVAGSVYSPNGNTVAASGGTGPYTFTISSGSLPTGLTMATSGVISGTPSAASSYSFTIQAADANGCTGSTAYSLVVGTSASSTNPTNQTACAGSTATFSVTGSGDAPLTFAWSKKSNAGWGNAWSRSGGGGEFVGSSTGNEAGGGTCASGFFVSGQLDINSSGGSALGMFGGSGGESATRNLGPISNFPSVVSIDVDNGSVDTGAKVGYSLEDSGGNDVLQFYFPGGQSNYKYNDGADHDTGIPFIRTGVRAKFILTSATTYTLLVTPCSGSTIEFNGTYSGTIARLKLMNGNGAGGIDNDGFFNNIIVNGFVDNADNYGGDWSGQDKGDAPVQVGTGNSYTTGALTAGNNGDQYQVVAYNAFGGSLSSAASLTVTTTAAPTGSASQSFCSSASPTVNDLVATGTAIQWYAASSGGSPLSGSTALVDGAHYFASQTANGCESTSRLDVAVTVNTTPGAPTGSASQSFCSASSPTVNDLAATGSGILWYAASSGGSPLSTSTALTNGTHYFSSQTVNGCESTARFDVTVTVDQPPTTASVGSDQTVSGLTSLPLGGNTPSVGMGSWSEVSGPGTIMFSAATSGNSTATARVFGTYVLRWTITNGSCSASFADLTVMFTGATTFTVTYNGNANDGGFAPVDNTNYNSGDTVTVLGNTGGLFKTGYTFTGWNTATDGSGTEYAPGAMFNISTNTTLYAQWIFLHVVSKSYVFSGGNTTVTVTLSGPPNQNLNIEYATGLVPSSWTAYLGNPVNTTGTGTFSIMITVAGDQRPPTGNLKNMFFRGSK